jgi:hypothetical protein
MSFFTSGAFWFVEGVLAVLAIIGLKIWMEDRNVPMRLWKWLLVMAWMLMTGFTIAFIGTSVGENEMVAAQKGGIVFSVACVIAGVVIWRLLQIGRVKTFADSKTSQHPIAKQESKETAGDEEV